MLGVCCLLATVTAVRGGSICLGGAVVPSMTAAKESLTTWNTMSSSGVACATTAGICCFSLLCTVKGCGPAVSVPEDSICLLMVCALRSHGLKP
jgi:hypothetical protein